MLDSGLVAFDVDGVLAPIVEHADDARLSPGVHDGLAALATRTDVAILSGRSLESLERLFAFPVDLHVIGSHGLEERGAGAMTLDDRERVRLEQLVALGNKAVVAIGDGAWLESKPASVVVHTRRADGGQASEALEALTTLAAMVDGAQVKAGHEVVELMARRASKGDALLALAARLGRRPVTFLGDDVTDEDAFRQMSGDDVSVKVGAGETNARYRLADAAAAAALVAALNDR